MNKKPSNTDQTKNDTLKELDKLSEDNFNNNNKSSGTSAEPSSLPEKPSIETVEISLEDFNIKQEVIRAGLHSIFNSYTISEIYESHYLQRDFKKLLEIAIMADKIATDATSEKFDETAKA